MRERPADKTTSFHSFVHSFIHNLLIHLLVHSSIHSFIYLFTHLFIHSFIHLFIHSLVSLHFTFIHLFYLFTHSFKCLWVLRALRILKHRRTGPHSPVCTANGVKQTDWTSPAREMLMGPLEKGVVGRGYETGTLGAMAGRLWGVFSGGTQKIKSGRQLL